MPHSFSQMQMYGHLVKSLLKFQNEPDRLVWNYVLLTCLRSNDNFTWNILSILCHFAVVRNGDIEQCAEGTSWNLVWGCSYMRWLNSLLRHTVVERGSFPPPLCWLWCLCNCTGSGSNLLIHEKTILTEKVNSFLLLSWRAALVYLCCQTGIQRWHQGPSREQSCKEWASAGTLPCGPG